jgi:hypothetical protein
MIVPKNNVIAVPAHVGVFQSYYLVKYTTNF